MRAITNPQHFVVFVLSYILVIDGTSGEGSDRLDAEQDPFESVTLDDPEGPSSDLFRSCLSASRTFEAKMYSIEMEDGTEFIRYVPDSWPTVPPTWEDPQVDTPVSSIAECAEAANNGGFPMFKYSGGSDCKVSQQMYDLEVEPACEEEAQDAVFVSSSASTACPLPRIQVEQSPSGSPVSCVLFNTGPFENLSDGFAWCGSRGSNPYTGPHGTTQVSTIKQLLQDLNVDSKMATAAYFYLDSASWVWDNNPLVPVDTTMIAGSPSTDRDDVMVFSPSAAFQFEFVPGEDYLGGVVCLEVDVSPPP